MTRNAERKGLFKWLISALSVCAYADEGTATPNAGAEPTSPPPVNFEALIAQARKEEKDKLYPQITKLKAEKESLTTSLNNLLLENGALKEELEKLKSTSAVKPEDSEVYKALQTKFDELTAENETLKKAPNEAEIRKQLEAEYEVKLYRNEQLEKNKGEILSMLTEDIKGTTKEEIDAAIAAAKEKTLSVKKDLGLVDDKGNPIVTNTTAPSKEPVKRVPQVAPAENNGAETFDAEYVRNLDPRSAEYAEFRKKMGLK